MKLGRQNLVQINKTYYDAKMVEIFVCTETPWGTVFVSGKKLTQKMVVPVWTGGDVKGKARHVIDTCQSTVAEPAHQLNTYLSKETETIEGYQRQVKCYRDSFLQSPEVRLEPCSGAHFCSFQNCGKAYGTCQFEDVEDGSVILGTYWVHTSIQLFTKGGFYVEYILSKL